MIICAGRNETFPFAKAIGVGLIESSINLTKICLEQKPKELIFIGSAGTYGNHKIFDIIQSNKAANIELAFLRDDAYTPIENTVKIKNENIKNDFIINSSNYISTNEELTKKYEEYGLSAENMEFYAVLKVAQEFNIRAYGVFVITNYTNEKAHEDFIKNHQEAKDKLVAYVKANDLINKSEENV